MEHNFTGTKGRNTKHRNVVSHTQLMTSPENTVWPILYTIYTLCSIMRAQSQREASGPVKNIHKK